jgi:glycosyltransferase involved in cell wall biosynthesis
MDTHTKQRIAFVTAADLSGTTGDSVATKEIVGALADRSDIEVELFSQTPTKELPTEIGAAVQRAVPLPKKPVDVATWRTLVWHGRFQATLARQLGQAIGDRRFDLVIARVNASMIVPPLLAGATRTPYSILVRGMVSRNISFGRIADRIVCLNSRLADNAYVAYQEVKETVDRCRPSTKPPSTVVPNAVDPEMFYPVKRTEQRDALGISSDEFVVGFVGTLQKRHRTEMLLRGAAEADRDVSILIVGDGPERSRLEAVANRLDIGETIQFVGAVAHSEVNRYISACDICYGVVDPERPSNPIKLYEYLACERPVITSRTDELEFIQRENFGATLDTLSPESIKTGIEQLGALSATERQEMGHRARNYIQNNHTWTAFSYIVCPNESNNDT